MVMPPHREGGQLQYAAAPLTARTPMSLGPVLDWATERLQDPLTVNDLATRARTSPRTLARRFTAQRMLTQDSGCSSNESRPHKRCWGESHLPVETIATRVGLSTATNLRRRFRTTLKTTPAAYRRSFGRAGST